MRVGILQKVAASLIGFIMNPQRVLVGSIIMETLTLPKVQAKPWWSGGHELIGH